MEHAPLWLQHGNLYITYDGESEAPAPVQILNSFDRRLVYRPVAAQANSIYYTRCPFSGYKLL